MSKKKEKSTVPYYISELMGVMGGGKILKENELVFSFLNSEGNFGRQTRSRAYIFFTHYWPIITLNFLKKKNQKF
jgi:hypothetical protein